MTIRTTAPQSMTLGVQLLIGLVLITMIVALVAGIVIHRNESAYLSDLVREEKAKIFQLITSSTLDDVISEDLPEIQTTMRQVIEKDPGLIAVGIENESGLILFHWQRQEGGGPLQRTLLGARERQTLSQSQPIELAGKTFGRITVAWDVSKSYREVTRHAILIIITVGGVCGLLSLLIHFLVAGFAIRPVIRISNRVSEFRKGIYDRPVELPKFASEELNQLNESVESLGRFLVDREWREAELTQAKELAESANRAKTSFLATMSHELRTPLNAVNGFSEIMSREMFGPLGDKRYREYVQQINFSGNHLLSLINDILDLSKVEAGKSELNMAETKPGELVIAAAELMREKARQGGLELIVEIAPDLPVIEADGRRVQQVLLNLLSNAIKFTPAGGRVLVDARWDAAEGIAVSVTDNGIGIAADKLDTAFEPFGQVESAYTRKFEGTGLGLPLVKALVQMHGGELTLESRLNVGTTARFTLPAELALAPPEAPTRDRAAKAGRVPVNPADRFVWKVR